MTGRLNLWCRSGLPGAGIALALVVLAGAEWALHGDALMHRLRSVFAVGRAVDKVLYVERNPPKLLVIGNSRMDNGVDPRTVAATLGESVTAFNLGLPGANATVLRGIVERFDADGLFVAGRIERVLVGLDEGLVQPGDALGYEVFFVDRPLGASRPIDYLRTHLRLWGYSDNLKQLREPAKLVQLANALLASVDPVGGGAADRLGYRPGFGAAQDAEQVARQEAGSAAPPDPEVVADFFTFIELLNRRGVEVEVVFPPLLNRTVLYLDPAHPGAAPYLAILRSLEARGVPMYALAAGERMRPAEFINAGHLNNAGAQRFSVMLAMAMTRGGGAGLVGITAAP